MSNCYLPEGRLLDTVENRNICADKEALQLAMEEERVLEGRALLCTPDRDLAVAFGPYQGVIPREEGALGIREGRAREIAILSRVGKPVAFTIAQIDRSGSVPAFVLSRRRAQELCQERLLHQTPAGSILPATVTHLESFGAFVDIGCGFSSMIGIENISVSRLTHTDQRFSPGQEIFVLLKGCNEAQGRVFLSHKELLGTWAENAARFSVGMTVPGYVRGIKEYGVFIELAPNLAGLADRVEGLRENERVCVYIKSISPEKMKIKLNILHDLPPESRPQPCSYVHTSGRLSAWSYTAGPICP